MNIVLAVLVGLLFAAGIFLMLRRSIFRLAIGLAILSHATNLLIFTAGGLVRAGVPVIPDDAQEVIGLVADPLPQALIMTAIVINFAVLAFALVLIYRTSQALGTEDSDEMRATDK